MRVSKAMLKRLASVEQRVAASRITALWPKIMSVDEWSELAQSTQEKLCQDT